MFSHHRETHLNLNSSQYLNDLDSGAPKGSVNHPFARYSVPPMSECVFALLGLRRIHPGLCFLLLHHSGLAHRSKLSPVLPVACHGDNLHPPWLLRRRPNRRYRRPDERILDFHSHRWVDGFCAVPARLLQGAANLLELTDTPSRGPGVHTNTRFLRVSTV